MEDAAGWIAPAATMVAAVMTAANLGARVTGWGFVVFTLGSIAWAIVGVSSGQTNLIATNVFLTLVNAIGVWRWLGREARYEAVGTGAEDAGRAPTRPSVFAATGIAGRQIIGNGGAVVADAVEAIIDCRTGTIDHVVARFGGVGGVGERLVAVPRGDLVFTEDAIATQLTADALRRMPQVDEGNRRSGGKDTVKDTSGHSMA